MADPHRLIEGGALGQRSAERLDLLDALSETGLKRITVGAFVSPRFVPQNPWASAQRLIFAS